MSSLQNPGALSRLACTSGNQARNRLGEGLLERRPRVPTAVAYACELNLVARSQRHLYLARPPGGREAWHNLAQDTLFETHFNGQPIDQLIGTAARVTTRTAFRQTCEQPDHSERTVPRKR